MEIELKVTVSIALVLGLEDPEEGDPLESRMAESAHEAVKTALSRAENAGFEHDMAPIASVSVLSVDPAAKLVDVHQPNGEGALYINGRKACFCFTRSQKEVLAALGLSVERRRMDANHYAGYWQLPDKLDDCRIAATQG